MPKTYEILVQITEDGQPTITKPLAECVDKQRLLPDEGALQGTTEDKVNGLLEAHARLVDFLLCPDENWQ